METCATCPRPLQNNGVAEMTGRCDACRHNDRPQSKIGAMLRRNLEMPLLQRIVEFRATRDNQTEVRAILDEAAHEIRSLQRQVSELRAWALNGAQMLAFNASNQHEYNEAHDMVAKIESGHYGEVQS